MAEWALVEDGEIKELHDLLPKNWRNVSGLNLSKDDPEFLRSLGWYAIVKHQPDHDTSQYTIDSYSYQLVDGKVVEVATLTPVTHQPSSEDVYAATLIAVRAERDRLLVESDWTQLADVQATMDESLKQQWIAYRQQLRDFTNNYKMGMPWPQIPLK